MVVQEKGLLMKTKSEQCQECGKCCKCMVLPLAMPMQKSESVMMDWLDARGCQIVGHTEDILYVKIDHPCPSLTKSGNSFGCGVYNSRPEGCRVFDGRNYDFLDCAWKENYVILEKGGPSRSLGRVGSIRLKGKVYSSDQKKRLAKRKSIEKKEERKENIAAYGSDIDKE
jgi:hypothetical protein